MPGGALLFMGRRIDVGQAGATIGRRSANDIVIDTEVVSRHHARVEESNGLYRVIDLGSSNGTYLNGERLSGAERPLTNGDTIVVGGETLRFLFEERTAMAGRGTAPPGVTEPVRMDGDRLRIGRSLENDLVLGDPSVSRFHAEVRRTAAGLELRDVGSSHGTRVDGQLVQRAPVTMGTEIGIGSHRLIFDGEWFVTRDDHGGLRIEAEGLHVIAGERRILDNASLTVRPGELVAIIGESGAGKSTLLKTMVGVIEPASGRVLVSGDPVGARLTDLGYVPQDEIVHAELTVTESLEYAARLRLPDDADASDVRAAVERVLGELGLVEHAAKRVGRLSGGQRKRVGVAIELLNRPGLLFLDEPTTGLDPGLEARSMQLFRQLAENERAVILVTHATRSLELCDRLVVMADGGHMCFNGSPRKALEFFGAGHYDEIYSRLQDEPTEYWRQRFRAEAARSDGTSVLELSPSPQTPPRRAAVPQAVLLTQRYLRLMWRDRRNLVILSLQVPVLALAIVSLFQGGVFDQPGGRAQDATQVLFLVLTTAVWFGAIDSAREIIKERAVLDRERSVGLRLSAYLASKAAVLLSLAAVQTVAMAAIVFAFRPLDEPATTTLVVVGLVVLASWVSVGMGLAISASVGTEDQATSFIPLALLPQLLFAGALVPIAIMGKVGEVVSAVMFERWAFAGVGSGLDMNARIADDRAFSRFSRFGDSFFELSPVVSAAILLGFLALMFGLTWLLVQRRQNALR